MTTFGSRWGNVYETDFGGAISRGDPTSMPESPNSIPLTETIDQCPRVHTLPRRLDTADLQWTCEGGTGIVLRCL